MKSIIAILEDSMPRTEAMRAAVSHILPDATCVFFDSAAAIIAWMQEHSESMLLVSLDHDLEFLTGPEGQLLDPGDGRDVAAFMAGLRPCCPVIVHTSNSMAATSMMFTLEEANWQVERVFPDGGLEWVRRQWVTAVDRVLRSGNSPRGCW